jgi:hypothetical protein
MKLGVIGVGGPAAHIALMRHEVVTRRRWLTEEEFLDLVGAVSLLPGPNSTELAIHIGRRRAGYPGLIVAGLCFILPAMFLVLACAWAYVRFGRVPAVVALVRSSPPRPSSATCFTESAVDWWPRWASFCPPSCWWARAAHWSRGSGAPRRPAPSWMA